MIFRKSIRTSIMHITATKLITDNTRDIKIQKGDDETEKNQTPVIMVVIIVSIVLYIIIFLSNK